MFLYISYQVQIEDVQTKQTSKFFCNDWLDAAEGDGRIRRDIQVRGSSVTYIVWKTTLFVSLSNDKSAEFFSGFF